MIDDEPRHLTATELQQRSDEYWAVKNPEINAKLRKLWFDHLEQITEMVTEEILKKLTPLTYPGHVKGSEGSTSSTRQSSLSPHL